MFPIRDYEEEEESLKTKLGEFSKIIVISRATKTSSRSKYKKGRVLTLLLLIRDDDEAEESLEAKLGKFSMTTIVITRTAKTSLQSKYKKGESSYLFRCC